MVGVTCHLGDKKFGTFCCVVPYVLFSILTWLIIPALTDPIPGWEGREGWTWHAWSGELRGDRDLRETGLHPHPSDILKQGMKEKEKGGG